MSDLSILDVIDGALADCVVSEDAMRWVPEEGREPDRPLSPYPADGIVPWTEFGILEPEPWYLWSYGAEHPGAASTYQLDFGVTWVAYTTDIGFTTDGAAFTRSWGTHPEPPNEQLVRVLQDALRPQGLLDPEPAPARELSLPHRVEASFTVPMDEHHARVAAEFTRACTPVSSGPCAHADAEEIKLSLTGRTIAWSCPQCGILASFGLGASVNDPGALEPVSEEFKALTRQLMDKYGPVLRRLAEVEARERAEGAAMRREYQRRLRNRRKR